MTQNRPVEALRMYWIAPDRNRSEPLIKKLAEIIQNLIREEGLVDV